MIDKLIDGEWYWAKLRNDDDWHPLKYSKKAAGGWTNDDTWEDFNKDVVDFVLIPTVHEIRLQ